MVRADGLLSRRRYFAVSRRENSRLRPEARRVDGLIADAAQAVRSTRPVLQNFDGQVSDVRAGVGALDAVRDTREAAHGVERALVRG